MAVTVKEIEYKNFGKCIEISNGEVEVAITTEIGPRIIKCGLRGGTNVMFNDEKREVVTENKSFDTHYYNGAKWLIYGGHRLWVSPEVMPDTYYPDCEPIEVELTDNGGLFTQKPQVQNGVQIKMRVTMDDDGEITVVHYVTNISDTEKRCSVWALTVLDKGGLEIIPNNTVDTGLLPNRRIIAWPYTDLNDERVYFGTGYIALRQDENASTAFKIGLDNHSGTALYAVGDAVFVNKYEHDINAEYDDFGVSFETYTSSKIMEMESLSPIYTLKTNETAKHTERWSVFKNPGTPNALDEKELERFVKRFI